MKKILVADDENLILYALSTALHGKTAEVKTVKNGMEALREIGAHFYDLCFLDIHLPDLNGLDIMKTIKEASPGTGIIIMTGSDLDDTAMRSIRENASLFFSKPFDLDMVKASVEKILERKESAHRNGMQAYWDYGSFVQLPACDKRGCERKFTPKTLVFSTDAVGGESRERKKLNAEVLDISDTGIGLFTTVLLEPGHVIRLSDIKEQVAAVVRWSMIVDNSDRYRVGARFISPEEPPPGNR
jgi:DNA-binding response OmpR family regulator